MYPPPRTNECHHFASNTSFKEQPPEGGREKMSVVVTNSGFFDGLNGKESACNVGDPDLFPGLGRLLPQV